MSKIRIIAGIYRSRLLSVPVDIEGLRPTPNRVRETLFNWLGQDLTSKTCLDLFAGSGALGFEAVSRCAKHTIMIENKPKVVKALNLTKNNLEINNLDIINGDALIYLEHLNVPIDIIFLDPPYSTNLLSNSLNIIKSKLCLINTIIYIEYQTPPDITGFEIIKSGKAGLVHYAIIKLRTCLGSSSRREKTDN